MVLFENEYIKVELLESSGDLKISVGKNFYEIYGDPNSPGIYPYWGLPEKKIYEGQIISKVDRFEDLLEDWVCDSDYNLVSSVYTHDLLDEREPIFVSDPVWSEEGMLLDYYGKWVYLDWSIKNEYLELYQKGFLIFSKVQ